MVHGVQPCVAGKRVRTNVLSIFVELKGPFESFIADFDEFEGLFYHLECVKVFRNKDVSKRHAHISKGNSRSRSNANSRT